MNTEAIQALLAECHRASYGWAIGCCAGSRTEAEEVLQVVYVKILEGEARYDGRAAFKTWLFAVIRRTAADERRRAVLCRLRLMKLHERTLIDVQTREATLPSSTEQSGLRTLLRDRLAQLPRRQQEI